MRRVFWGLLMMAAGVAGVTTAGTAAGVAAAADFAASQAEEVVAAGDSAAAGEVVAAGDSGGRSYSAGRAQEEAVRQLLRVFAADGGDFQALRQMDNAVQEAIVKLAIKNLDADALPSLGSGAQVIYEFSDYQCGFCRRMYPAVEEAVQNHDARVVLIEFPILGPWSTNAAAYALAAQAQGKFAAFHRAMMISGGGVNLNKLEYAAEQAQLDRARLDAYLDSDTATAAIEKNYQLALLLGINGTPAFIIDGEVYRGALQQEDFISLLTAGEHDEAKVEAEDNAEQKAGAEGG